MAEKSKAKKAKTISKKASPKARKAEVAPVFEEEEEEEVEAVVSPAIKRAKIGKIIARSSSVEAATDATLSEGDEGLEAESPPLERKFLTAETAESRNLEHSRQQSSKPQQETNEQLHIKLSRSLTRKLREQAADEGIGLDEFIAELLAESVVLRAWEIVERKNQMKGGQQMGNGRSNQPNGGGQQQNRNSHSANNNQRTNNNNNKGGGHRGMNHSRYQNIMEDKASFLEYVRSQERKPR